MRRIAILFAACLLAACAPAPAAVTPQLVNAYVTSAAYPRLGDLYGCAPPALVIGLSDPASAQLTLRLGEPASLTTPAFQVGTDDVLVVTHPQAGVGSLKLDQVQGLFAGRVTNWKEVGGSDLPVQVWAFGASEDVQQIFDRLVMDGQPLTSLARLAVSSQAMSDGVGNTPGSIGFLPRRWKAGNTREVLRVATVPVLLIASSEPQGPVRELVACMQARQ